MIVAIQGASGSFSDGAARRLAGPAADLLHCADFEALFAAVTSGAAALGVVPVHNTIVGPVCDNGARVRSGAFVVLERLRYPVSQALIAARRTAIAKLRRVASHPVALRQCTGFFAAHPACEPVPVADTGSGVRDLMNGSLAVDAVIASAEASRLYGGTVLLERVDDAVDNATDFILIACKGFSRPTRLPL